MDYSSVRWFSELGMDDPTFLQHFDLNSLDQFAAENIADALEEDFPHHQHYSSSDSYNSCTSFEQQLKSAHDAAEATQALDQRPAKVLKSSNSSSCKSSSPAGKLVTTAVVPPDVSSPSILHFGKPGSPTLGSRPPEMKAFFGGAAKPKVVEVVSAFSLSQISGQSNYGVVAGCDESKRGRPPPNNQDHILAERKRREKLSQRFIALSAVVPGLKKMDKASVLGDAIKYVKQLQDRVRVLEDETAKKTVESVVLIKKSQLPADDDNSSSTGESFAADGQAGPHSSSLPEIEARVSERTVFLRVHCERRKGAVVKVLAEVENLNLTVSSTSVMPFAASFLDITVAAQMEEEFSMTVKELVRSLNSAFSKFM